MLKINIITLFPKMFKGPFGESIIKRAQDESLVEINIHNLRKWTNDKRGTVDDRPYGGGVGMVMMVEPIDRAIEDIKIRRYEDMKIVLLSPRGKKFDQEKAREFSKLDQLILICGHYEGIDERVSEHLIDEEISIGDYVLTGGEIPAMVITDAVTRLIPEVLDPKATELESFQSLTISKACVPNKNEDCVGNIGHQSSIILEGPQYTRPEEYKGWKVPEILLGGNHAEIEKWRKEKALEKTKKERPELING